MRGVAVDACLALGVLSVWLAALGFLRLRSALDRLHCVTFVNAAGGFALVLAAFFQEGVTPRSVKLLALVLGLLVMGAATTHATGRALLLRGGPDQ